MSVFRFKQFVVDQSGAAMKINTDGVLLGAMAVSHAPEHILDIGTGTGVIALMLAQRFPSAQVDAIEVDQTAAAIAERNCRNSPFSRRTAVYATDLADYVPAVRYDLIVSNPPYFVDALRNRDVRKRLARHADRMFFDALLERGGEWLTEKGSLQLILPMPFAEEIIDIAVHRYGLQVQWQRDIRSFIGAPVLRRVVALGQTLGHVVGEQADVVIFSGKGVHSPTYRTLLKEFFLAF